MKFKNDNITGKVTIEHRAFDGVDYELSFSMSLFRKGKKQKDLMEEPSPFDTLNRFLTRCSEDQLENIFHFYYNCRVILDDIVDSISMSKKLSQEIKKLAEIIPLQTMINWVKFYSDLRIPDDLMDKFDDFEDKSLVTRERTYVREDYVELMAWILCLRFIAPIWGTYVDKNSDVLGTTWKLCYAYDLINESSYADCPPAIRLNNYITATIPATTDLNSAILKGISKTDYPHWLLTSVVIRRIVLHDLEDQSENSTLIIKIIYKYVIQKIQQQDKQFSGLIKTVGGDESSGPTDNDTTSPLEGYSSRQLISDGDIQIAEYYLREENIANIINKLDPQIPVNLVYEAFENIKPLFGISIAEPQIILTKWVINRVVSARMLDYISRKPLLVAMAVAASWYWHKGFYSLSLLTTASKVDNKNEHQLTGTEKRKRIIKEMYDRIAKEYPYYQKTTGKKTEREKLSAIVSIEYLEKMLTNYDWFTYAPDSWINGNILKIRSRQYAVPEDIKANLVDLAIVLSNFTPLRSPL